MKSILHDKTAKTCYLCALLNSDYNTRSNLEEHHIFGGYNRAKSEKYGLKVYLCPEHHRISDNAVHREDKNNNKRLLQAIAQEHFTDYYTNLDFISIFGKNYRI